MTAPPPPTDREALEREIIAELDVSKPGWLERVFDRITTAQDATIADLRSKLAAVEGDGEEILAGLPAVMAARDAAEAERDALAGMTGEGFREWAGALAKAIDAAERAVKCADALDALLTAADSRAREAGARAERYATLLQPLAAYAAVALPPEGIDGEIGERIVGAFRRSIRTADLRAILAEFPQSQEIVNERF